MTLEEKDVLKLLGEGPTLRKLTERIGKQSQEEILPQSIGDILLTLRDKGYAFLEEGRWWRTPEGVAYLDRLLAEEPADQSRFPEKERYEPTGTLTKKLWQVLENPVFALVLSVSVLALKLSYALAYLQPGWDSTIYLLNARRFLYGYDPFRYFELLRPPLLPLVISQLWGIFGESYFIAVLIQPVSTILAGLVLYVIASEMFDRRTAILSLSVFLFAPDVFLWSNRILTHGVELLFALLSIFFAWRISRESVGSRSVHTYVLAALVGVFAGLASLTRYPAIMFFPAVLVLILRRRVMTSLERIVVCGLGFILPWSYWLRWNTSYAGGDPFASVKAAFQTGALQGASETAITINPWYIYVTSLVGLVTVVGIVFLAAGVVSRESLSDRKRLMFVCWFMVATAASSILQSRSVRFMVDWFPAISTLISFGAIKIHRTLGSRSRKVFDILIASWLIYLAWSSTVLVTADLRERNGPREIEFPTVVSWATTNMAKTDIGVSDLYAPQFNYYAKRLFYSFVYVEDESIIKGVTIRETLARLNVTYIVVTTSYAQDHRLETANYLTRLKNFENFVAYAFVDTGRGTVPLRSQPPVENQPLLLPLICERYCLLLPSD